MEYARLSGRRPEEILDFSANINPLGPPQWLRSVISCALDSVVRYPDPHCTRLVAAAARRYRANEDQILVGNGSTELLYLIPRAVGLPRAVIPVPCYADYLSSSFAAGMAVETMPLEETSGFAVDLGKIASHLRGHEIVLLSNPHNPTGLLLQGKHLRQLASDHPSSLFLVDEAFGDFVEGMDSLSRDRPENVVVLLSLTKIYAIPGLRLGCAVANNQVAKAVRRLQPPWSVNTLALAVGERALQDLDYVEQSRKYVAEQRKILRAELEALAGLKVFPSSANFLFARLDRADMDARCLAKRLLDEGIAIRVCDNFIGLDSRFFRVAVRREEENQRLCNALRRALGVKVRKKKVRRPPAVMFQGTSSNSGKSVLTAALCRILLQDGYRVAPFKAQNMSLNSFVTRAGGEMGRAQVVQAQACRLEPDVHMNPILLKPNSDKGAQVIVWGKPVGNMDVADYIRYKPKAFEAAKRAYDELAREHDVIVLEGAGSPAEVNIKHHDIVNMRMAQYAGAHVLIVGDIDRGGVFASFVGTMELLAEWERAMVAGFVVNRFRGQQDLLQQALEYTLEHTGRPVLGVVPYFPELGLPEEDSVSFKSGLLDQAPTEEHAVEIAVLDLPHISNFTDFDPLRLEPDVRLRIARRVEDLISPDAVILPGSKNVLADIEYLKDRGLSVKIEELARQGKTELVGICGGFQILGTTVADPHCLESDGRTARGLGLLDISTVLVPEKILRRVKAAHMLSGLEVQGYEIHHGLTRAQSVRPVLRLEDGSLDGAVSLGGRAWGTYLHGIFEADEFRRWFIDGLRARRGLSRRGMVCARYDLEPALDRLAGEVRQHLDVERIYRTMGLR
jgi:adenosylcobyric acid synthase